MSEDTYFKAKATECFDSILSSFNNKGNKLSTSEIEQVLYTALKEVARDQRYTCIEAFNKEMQIPRTADEWGNVLDAIPSILHNAQIKG